MASLVIARQGRVGDLKRRRVTLALPVSGATMAGDKGEREQEGKIVDNRKDTAHVSASEIGEYVYCHRQWWYAAQDLPSLSTPMMRQGVAEHERIQQQVTYARHAVRPPRGLGCATALLGAVALGTAILGHLS